MSLSSIFDIFQYYMAQIFSIFYKLPKIEIHGYYLNYFIFFIIVLFFAGITRKNLNPAKHPYLFALIELPGTIVHEFSHAFVAVLFGNKILKISIFPKVTRNGNQVQTQFGYVKTASAYKGSTVLSSIAPLFLVPLIVYGLFYYIDTFDIQAVYSYLLKLFVLVFILPSAILSRQDLKNFFENLLSINGLIIFASFLFILYYFFPIIYKHFNNFVHDNFEMFFYFIFITLIIKLFSFVVR